MFVKICNLGEEQEVTTFTPGTHVLGRGPTLQCNDKRVSRNHATLEVTEDKVKLTSIHVNPCFLKAANSKTITILSKDSTTELNDGDSFALLPEDFWFKIKLVKEEANGVKTKEEEGSKETNKRFSVDYPEDAPLDKKAKLESNDENIPPSEVASTSAEESETHIVSTEQDNSVTSQSAEENHKNEEVKPTELPEQPDASTVESTSEEPNDLEPTAVSKKEEMDETLNQEVADANDPSQSDGAPKEESKKEEGDPPALDGGSAGNASPPQPRPRREKCWYGAECYRKNPKHRQDLAHPGDSDFESDPDDNRPSCSYGAACYRKNKAHRQQYKHPPRERPAKKKRSRKKVNRLNAADSQDLRELDEELFDSEEEDPFVVDDDDSDEYTGESDDDDSDFEDSQEADEDSGNVKRLLREAKGFANK